MSFGQILLHLRNQKGIQQKELAQFLQVSIGTVSNYERDVHDPDFLTLCRLADFFDVSTDYLLERTPLPVSFKHLSDDLTGGYTFGDLLNELAQLSPQNLSSLVDYMDLLSHRNVAQDTSYQPSGSKSTSPVRGKTAASTAKSQRHTPNRK